MALGLCNRGFFLAALGLVNGVVVVFVVITVIGGSDGDILSVVNSIVHGGKGIVVSLRPRCEGSKQDNTEKPNTRVNAHARVVRDKRTDV